MRSLLLFLALILLPLPCYTHVQTAPEKGDVKEIANLSKAYVSADSIYARKMIQRELEDYKKVTVVDSKDEAEFFIEYKILKRRGGYAGIFGKESVTTISEMVVYTLSDKGRRVVWSKTSSDDRSTERIERTLTRSFVKALKKASGDQ